MSKSPEPELPPETSVFTLMPLALDPSTRAVSACRGEIFLTAPLGWWTPKICSFTPGRS